MLQQEFDGGGFGGLFRVHGGCGGSLFDNLNDAMVDNSNNNNGDGGIGNGPLFVNILLAFRNEVP